MKRAILLAVVAVVLLLAILHLYGPSYAPPGQQPLFALSSENFAEFEKEFDADAGAPRMLLLLSPT